MVFLGDQVMLRNDLDQNCVENMEHAASCLNDYFIMWNHAEILTDFKML